MLHQIENINKQLIDHKEEPTRNSEIEKYSNWNEKFTTEDQQ